MSNIIPFRPRQPKSPVPPRLYDSAPLTHDELLRIEELLTEAAASDMALH